METAMKRDYTWRDGFYVAFASAMLLTVLAGFAKTFFARSHFGTLDMLGAPELPVHLLVHGIILTSWFVLFLAQTLLVATRRTAVHRRLGIVGVVLAALVVVSGLITVVEVVPRAALAKMPAEGFGPVVFGNSAALAAFAICIVRGVLRRSEPAVHRRMMTIASASITAQAGTRVGELFGLSPFALGPPTLVAFLLTIVAYDLVAERRVHPATIWGCVVVIVCFATFVIFGNSPFGDAIVELLRSPRAGA
jgi:hypothetical protein